VTPEGFIKNQICSWLTRHKALFFVHDSVGIFDPTRKVYRTNKSPYRIKGVADIIGIWKERPLAIEVKSGKGRLSLEQKSFLSAWGAAGGIGIAAWSVEDVQNVLKPKDRE